MHALVVPIVLVLIVVVTLRNTRRAPNVHLCIDGSDVVVELRGWDAFYCCRRRIQVPTAQVLGVGVCARDRIPVHWLRMPGTSIPGVIRAGSYGVRGRQDFWDVRSAPQVLVIQLSDDAPYRRIVLEVADPRETMLALRPLLGPLDWTPAGV